MIALAYLCRPFEDDVRLDNGASPDFHVLTDIAPGTDTDVLIQLCPGFNDGGRVYHAPDTPLYPLSSIRMNINIGSIISSNEARLSISTQNSRGAAEYSIDLTANIKLPDTAPFGNNFGM